MKNVCFVCVIHEKVKPYLKDFVDSLDHQTTDNFDFIVFNDGLNIKDLDFKFSSTRLKIINVFGSPVEIRNCMIRFLISSNYEYCVFGDADDFFEKNRIAENLRLLQTCDLVVNDVHLVDSKGQLLKENYFSKRIKNHFPITPEFLVDKNIIGLGNTAIKVKLLSEELIVSENLIAVDWQIFSRVLLLNNTKAIFTNNTSVFYRQYDGNIIGLDSLTYDKLKFILNVKVEHYRELFKFSKKFRKYLHSYLELEEYLKDDSSCKKYLSYLNKNKNKYPFWWEEIKPLKEIDYENSIKP